MAQASGGAESNGLMRGRRGLIMGLANNRSIAWGIAKACHAAGAELAFTYQGDALKKRVEPLAQELGGIVAGHCDVTDTASIDALPPRAASGQEAVRTVATTVCPAGACTVMMALPA